MFFMNNDVYIPSANGGMTVLPCPNAQVFEEDFLRDFLNELEDRESLASDMDLFTA